MLFVSWVLVFHIQLLWIPVCTEPHGLSASEFVVPAAPFVLYQFAAWVVIATQTLAVLQLQSLAVSVLGVYGRNSAPQLLRRIAERWTLLSSMMLEGT